MTPRLQTDWFPGISRRYVLGGLAGLVAAADGGVAATMPVSSPVGRVAIVSTWDFWTAANAVAFARLRAGGSVLDAIEAGAHVPEADPSSHSVGYGGYPDRDGRVTLDAINMNDQGRVGAVARLENTVHAVSVALGVMEDTPRTMLVGAGATHFARVRGFARRDLLTPPARAAWREWLKTSRYAPVANIENRRSRGDARDHDTIDILARGRDGRLAGACTTSDMAFKMRGQVGDSPQSGCGMFVEAQVGTATATGLGEEVTRISARVVASMRGGMDPQAACREACAHIARRGDRGSANRLPRACRRRTHRCPGAAARLHICGDGRRRNHVGAGGRLTG